MTGRQLRAQAVFGGFDGVSTAIGAVAGSRHLALGLALCVSIAGMMSMAAGEWLSADTTGLAGPAVMGAATFAGTVAPCLPAILVGGTVSLPGAALIGLAVAVAVGQARGGHRHDLAVSVGTFVAVAIPTALAGAAFGGLT